MANAEKVEFRVNALRYMIVIRPESLSLSPDGRIIQVPAKIAKFENGVYVTSNPEEIKAIRNSIAYKEGVIFEISEVDRKIVEASINAKKQKTIRGSINTQTIAQEAEVPEETVRAEKLRNPKVKLEEKKAGPFVCDVCKKEFSSEMALRGHKISHRRGK
jgi:predicted HNH restriction endonuclease